ncbi:MAG: hypothetical protein IT370_01755 [Deltaproteobacteria bacterium]|nr:hypothetical protein [Deltaproteobacteria bacterium]
MRAGAVLLLAVLAVAASCRKQRRTGAGGGASPSPSGALPTECATDADCGIDYGRGCCGHPCGSTPPWRAANVRAIRDADARNRAACALENRECPTVSCASQPECRTRPIARCRAGACAVEVALDGVCAGWSCPARCGAQPPAPPDDSYQCGIRYEWGWAACCCEGASAGDGGAPRACAGLALAACSWASVCKVRPGDLAPAGPLPTCETPAP